MEKTGIHIHGAYGRTVPTRLRKKREKRAKKVRSILGEELARSQRPIKKFYRCLRRTTVNFFVVFSRSGSFFMATFSRFSVLRHINCTRSDNGGGSKSSAFYRTADKRHGSALKPRCLGRILFLPDEPVYWVFANFLIFRTSRFIYFFIEIHIL